VKERQKKKEKKLRGIETELQRMQESYEGQIKNFDILSARASGQRVSKPELTDTPILEVRSSKAQRDEMLIARYKMSSRNKQASVNNRAVALSPSMEGVGMVSSVLSRSPRETKPSGSVQKLPVLSPRSQKEGKVLTPIPSKAFEKRDLRS
jgi:hypothetical protein